MSNINKEERKQKIENDRERLRQLKKRIMNLKSDNEDLSEKIDIAKTTKKKTVTKKTPTKKPVAKKKTVAKKTTTRKSPVKKTVTKKKTVVKRLTSTTPSIKGIGELVKISQYPNSDKIVVESSVMSIELFDSLNELAAIWFLKNVDIKFDLLIIAGEYDDWNSYQNKENIIDEFENKSKNEILKFFACMENNKRKYSLTNGVAACSWKFDHPISNENSLKIDTLISRIEEFIKVKNKGKFVIHPKFHNMKFKIENESDLIIEDTLIKIRNYEDIPTKGDVFQIALFAYYDILLFESTEKIEKYGINNIGIFNPVENIYYEWSMDEILKIDGFETKLRDYGKNNRIDINNDHDEMIDDNSAAEAAKMISDRLNMIKKRMNKLK